MQLGSDQAESSAAGAAAGQSVLLSKPAQQKWVIFTCTTPDLEMGYVLPAGKLNNATCISKFTLIGCRKDISHMLAKVQHPAVKAASCLVDCRYSRVWCADLFVIDVFCLVLSRTD